MTSWARGRLLTKFKTKTNRLVVLYFLIGNYIHDISDTVLLLTKVSLYFWANNFFFYFL